MADQGTSKPAATPPAGDADQDKKQKAAQEAEEKRQADMVAAVEKANKEPVPGSEES